jgi:dTDP-glucose 4,6-dehydratase
MQFVPDRLGHDRRYAIDSTKITNELDWRIETKFEENMLLTIEWYKRNFGR